jgi:pseudouridine-5'-phosphate glycosidase
LIFTDVKSMVSAGLTSLSSSYDLARATSGQNTMKVLCIGHGGGTLPLFLASKFEGKHLLRTSSVEHILNAQFGDVFLLAQCGQVNSF